MGILIFSAAVFLGAFIQSVSGFGFGIFVMLIFPFILPVSECAAVSGLLSMVSSFALGFYLRKKCNFKRILFPILGYIIGSLPAILISDSTSNDFMKKVLAVILIVLSLYFLLFQSKLRIRESLPTALAVGFFSGILGGFFAMGGPPIVAYLIQTSKDNDSYMAEVQMYFGITNLISSIIRAIGGIITVSVLCNWGIGLVALFLGTVLGRKIFKYIDSKRLKLIVYCFMLVSGVINLF